MQSRADTLKLTNDGKKITIDKMNKQIQNEKDKFYATDSQLTLLTVLILFLLAFQIGAIIYKMNMPKVHETV